MWVKHLFAAGASRRAANLGRRSLGSLNAARNAWDGRLVISEEVEHALQNGLPVVALESAIITHGMPYPANLTTASSLESIIRSNSCIPATIALLSGRVHIGLTEAQLGYLSDTSKAEAVKVSRRDLGAAVALGKDGGTTVAGTMVLAHSVGIKTFVTGGIGGVHRGAENSMDVSADLIELGRTPMAVICAGAKSILDIPRTLEVLETQGVCVATYGGTSDFPAFYTPSSGKNSPWKVSTIKQAADLIYTSLSLPSPLSTLLAVPIPSEHADRGNKVQEAVEQAVRESVEQGIDKRGKEVTPWLLKRVGELTHGSALELNVKLIENNAQIGSKVAKEVSRLFKERQERDASSFTYFSGLSRPQKKIEPVSTSYHVPQSPSLSKGQTTLPPPRVQVFGSAAIDITSTSGGTLLPRTTTPGQIYLSPGGVGRNIAEAAQNLLPSNSVQLVSLVGLDDAGEGPDAFGKVLMLEMENAGLRTDGLSIASGGSTAVCNLILEKDGDLVNGVADMDIIEKLSERHFQVSGISPSTKPVLVVFDCNPTEQMITHILTTCLMADIPTFCDPTSFNKLEKLFKAFMRLEATMIPNKGPFLTHASPNLRELDLLNRLTQADLQSNGTQPLYPYGVVPESVHRSARSTLSFSTLPWTRSDATDGKTAIELCIPLLRYVQHIWLKDGSNGLLHARFTTSNDTLPPNSFSYAFTTAKGQEGFLAYTHYSAPVIDSNAIVSTTGAGDTLVGGLVAGLVSGEDTEEVWVGKALDRVRMSLRSRRAVG